MWVKGPPQSDVGDDGPVPNRSGPRGWTLDRPLGEAPPSRTDPVGVWDTPVTVLGVPPVPTNNILQS